MTAKNFFTTLLKILGLIFIKNIVDTIPMIVMGFRELLSSEVGGQGVSTLAFGLLFLLMYMALCYIFIFKADQVVHKLTLAHGLEEPFLTLNFSMRSVLMVAAVVAGFLLLIIEIPAFCRELSTYFLARKMTLDTGSWSAIAPQMITTMVKILLGLLIIGERKKIVGYLLKKQN